MPVPTFNGQAIFGLAATMTTSDNPRDKQINSYFGVDGLETLDAGLRGRYTKATGLLGGFGPLGLSAAVEAFRSFNDGRAYTLTTTLGRAWANVRLESFDPSDRIMQDADGNWFQQYTAVFFHLS